ncbi:magnesium transporter CorA family protein [Patescibacteria group bacterium]|nr:magnesium transporter CorA family protein [Patescibacteria group bacterium]
MSVKTLKQKNLTWINIDKLDDEVITYLKENYNFHQLDYEDLQGEVQTPKIDVYKNYLFLVFHFPQWNQLTKKIRSHEVDVFIGEDYLITIQHTRSKEMKNFFYRCIKNKKVKADWMQRGPGYLLYRLTESLFRNSQPILDIIGKQMSDLENEIYSGEQDIKTIRELAIHRRNILQFRRILDPQRYLISNLSHIRKPFLDEGLVIYFDNVNDYLSKIWSITDTYRDTIDGLHVTVESLINHRTNKVISALTVISVSLLPLTLLSGIYGMNIIGLPHAQNPFWVWLMFVGLLAVILLVVAVMKKKKWL